MNADQGNGFIEVQGVKYFLPNPCKKYEIINYGTGITKQKWKRTELPIFMAKDIDVWNGDEYKADEIVSWEEACRQEHIKIFGTDPFDLDKQGNAKTVAGVEPDMNYSMECLENFREQELNRFYNGVWIYIKGNLYHIPGCYYFYLNYWQLKDGFPEFRYIDLELFWVWEAVRKSKNFLGMIYITMKGAGKCFGRGTKIRMFDGSVKNVENIKKGELVMGDDSTPRAVHGVTSGTEEMYRITPNQGEPFTCNKSHILSLIYNGVDIRKHNLKRDSIVNISVGDYLKLSDNKKTRFVLFRNGWNVTNHNRKHFIPPYILGAHLGDGTQLDGVLTCPDNEIISKFRDYAKSIGHDFKRCIEHNQNEIRYRIVSKKNGGRRKNDYLDELRRLGVTDHKHIPNLYLNDGIENRMQLLAGIIDTDGYFTGKGYEVVQKRKILSDNIVLLCRSLGFYASVSEKLVAIKYKNSIGRSRTYYRITISGNVNQIPCIVKRKNSSHRKFNKRQKSNRTGFKIESIGIGNYYGFGVDGNNLFLLEDGTVVHNSYIAGCINYYEAVTTRKANTTIQSKSDDDAADFFRDKVLLPMTQLPDFLIPIHKHPGDITSLNAIEFVPKARKGMNMRHYLKMKKEALYSKMQYHPSGELAAEGGTWTLIIHEEMGKTKPTIADVYKRIMAMKLSIFRVNKKMGNMFASSTVEDMKEGGAECFKVWKESNQYELNETNTTNTGLVRFFRSAIDATMFDEYGFSVGSEPQDKETKKYILEKYGDVFGKLAEFGAKAVHDAKRKALSHDQQGLVSYIQKNPYNEKEAFWINAEKCIYNAQILLAAKDRILNSDRKYTRRGNIEWLEKDVKAVWVDNDKNGKWEVSFFDFEQNMVQINDHGEYKTFTPKASHKRVMAFDPYSARDIVDEKRGSDAAAVVYNKPDFHIPDEYCDTIIADYLYRHAEPFDSYEDIICGCFFFGCEVLIEKNKTNALDYFIRRGYKWGRDSNSSDFVMSRPESTLTEFGKKVTDGIVSTDPMITHYTNSTRQHINTHGHKLKHIRPIEDWIKFNPDRTQEFDMAVAASFAIVAAEKKITEKGKEVDISGIFKRYDNSGSQSKIIGR